MENQRQSESKKYYIPLPKTENAPTGYIDFYRDFQFVEVSEEVYRTYYQPIWRVWKETHKHGACRGTEWKRCLGDCATCTRYQRGSHILSLDVVVDEDECTTVADTLIDPEPLIDEVLTQNAVLEELLDALQELDPDGRRIGELLLEGKTKVEISSILGIARTTYNYRFDKLRKSLAERLKK